MVYLGPLLDLLKPPYKEGGLAVVIQDQLEKNPEQGMRLLHSEESFLLQYYYLIERELKRIKDLPKKEKQSQSLIRSLEENLSRYDEALQKLKEIRARWEKGKDDSINKDLMEGLCPWICED